MRKNILIVGGGNMGQAIVFGLLRSKVVPPRQLMIFDRSPLKLKHLKSEGVTISHDIQNSASEAGVIILAVKPGAVSGVIENIKGVVGKDALLVSVAAGTSLQDLEKFSSGKHQAVIRVMPNICAKIGESMSVWVKNKHVGVAEERFAIKILRSFGKEIRLRSDDDIDAATAISGSGPAYVFYLAERLMVESQRLGLQKSICRDLVVQTLYGASMMLTKEKRDAEELRAVVTSPNGTTAAAFAAFAKYDLAKVLHTGVVAAARRARELKRKK